MRRISARDIQSFVGGALALAGFYPLIRLPFNFFYLNDEMALLHSLFTSVIAGLNLALGMAILAGSREALRVTRIYLGLQAVGGLIILPVYIFLSSHSSRLVGSVAPELIVFIILLCLISWSRSQRFGIEPTA